jgi:ketosteroid isomerase-like protein
MGREHLENTVRALYQDIFDSGNCPAVDAHYEPDMVCYFNDLELTLDNLKASMAKFIELHRDVKTDIKHLLIDGNHTFAHLERRATDKQTGQEKVAKIMVVKEFNGNKIAKVWFMSDDVAVRSIWSEKSNTASACSA